jgi:ssDNA-binding Zn-finger/Zn-ribbon topoisomerase 1
MRALGSKKQASKKKKSLHPQNCPKIKKYMMLKMTKFALEGKIN